MLYLKKIISGGYSSRLLIVAIHTIAWIIIASFPFITGLPPDFNILQYCLRFGLMIFLFYFNSDFLIPRLLIKKKIISYIAAVTVVMSVLGVFNIFLHETNRQPFDPQRMEQSGFAERRVERGVAGNRPPPPPNKFIIPAFFPLIFIFALSTTLKVTNEWYKNEREKKDLENTTLTSELSFLKSQINPHFLFNTLNNLYALAIKQSENTAPALMKLSQLMRYMLHEASGPSVSLLREIDSLRDFIDLQKLRLPKGISVSFFVKGNIEVVKIEPLLFMPFVENAFKHGISYHNKTSILINLEVQDDILMFDIINPVHDKQENEKPESASGIGLKNVIRRLNLLYPNTHVLEIFNNKDNFQVHLKLNLKKYEMPGSR